MSSRYRFLLAPFILYPPLAILLCLWAWREGTLPWAMSPAFMVLGVVAWTLIEYLLHRFLLHYHARTAAIRHVVEKLHLGHHRDPADEAKITVPVYASLPIALALLGLLRLIGGSWEVSALMMSGVIAGYLYYEAVHFRIHRGSQGGAALRLQRTWHLFHHHKDATHGFGVTSPLWDWVFRTHPRPRATPA